MAFDIEKIRDVLRRATTGPGAKWSRRSLSSAADEGRDCVSDIINGRNKNPTVKVLTNLAQAMNKDVSIFGLMPNERLDVPSVEELEAALVDVLPGMPRGSVEKRARYLAETVSDVLGLPPTRSATSATERFGGKGDSVEDALPR